MKPCLQVSNTNHLDKRLHIYNTHFISPNLRLHSRLLLLTFFNITTYPDSCDRLRRSHIMQYRCGYCKLKYLWGFYEGTLDAIVTGTTPHEVAAEYPHSNLQGTSPTCSGHSSTALHTTYVASQKEFSCVINELHTCINKKTHNYCNLYQSLVQCASTTDFRSQTLLNLNTMIGSLLYRGTHTTVTYCDPFTHSLTSSTTKQDVLLFLTYTIIIE